MKLGDTIFNGNKFKNVILNSVSYKRLILGVNLVWSYFGIAINAFRTRILADGGNYESESILEDRLQEITPNLFDSASLVITPNGVKTSKLYSIKPNDGTGDLSVVRNTSATRIDENGNIVDVSANVARIDYSNGSPAILVEPQRTNLLLRSQEFNNSYWGKQSGATVIQNTEISPDGNQNADTINLVSGSTISRIEKASIAYAASTSYTLSFYFKNISLTSGQTFQMRFEGNAFDLRGTIDLANKTNTVSLTGKAVSGFVSGSQIATLKEYGNGWVRCSIGLTTGTNIGYIAVYLITNVDANRSFYAWGAQLEAGSNATSYIPTTTSSVTRNADVISKTGLSGITSITETFENGTTNVISGSPTSYTMSQGRIKHVIGL